MSDVTRLLDAAAAGDGRAAADLLPLVYDELRRLAAARLAHEKPGQTLDATGLVHEAYLRLMASGDALGHPLAGRPRDYANRGHFFAAVAEAMRRILVDQARRKRRLKHGGGRQRVEFPADVAANVPDDDLLVVDDLLDQLAVADSQAAELVKLHVYAGLTIDEAAALLGISPRTAYRDWQFARAWMAQRLGGEN